MPDRVKSIKPSFVIAATALLLGLYVSSGYSYLLFHSLIEFTTITIAFTLLILTWHSRRFLTTGFLKAVGIGYGLIAIIDLLHTLAYRGMGVFPGYGANLATQLWIAARYLQALLLLVAPLYTRRNINERLFFAISLAAVSALTALVFSGNFPDCFIEGKGLTPFKIASEYVISGFLLLALFSVMGKRREFKAGVFTLIVASLICTICSELAFTSYLSVYGTANMVGHFLKLAAFYIVYRAVVVTGFMEPFDLIFMDLKQTEDELRRHKDNLEETVRERTASLQTEVVERKRVEESLLRSNRQLVAISNCNQALVRAEDEQTLLDDICRIICEEAGYRMAWVGYAEYDEARSIRPVAWAGVEEGYLAKADITWADTERGRGPGGMSIRSGKSTYVQDFATDPNVAPWREGALQRGYRSVISLPLKNEKDETFGTLAIYSTEPNAFTPDEINLLEELAGDLAFGVNFLRAHNARREAERRIALLNFALDNVRESAFLTDESARFLYVNEEACHGLNYSRDELLRLGVPDVDPDFPMQRWPGHWDGLKKRGSLTFEGRHMAKDGRIFPVDISANYFEYESQGYNLALVRDITERNRVEDTLRFIAQRGWAGTADTFLTALAAHLANTLGMDYVLIAHFPDDGYCMAETSALYAKGEILPNTRYELKGTPCENVAGRKLCLYPEGIQALFPADTLLVEMGAESYAGIPLWDSAGRPIGLLAALDGRPIHDENTLSYILQLAATSAAAALERERDDRFLTAREREFRSLAENIPDNIARYDRNGRTLYINPSLEKVIGIKLEDALGKTPRERKQDNRFDEYIETLENVVSTGVGNTLELTFPDGNDDFVHHQINFVPELDQDGEMIGILAIGRDITELRQSMRKLIAEQQSRAEMALELSMAEERERHAIAAELHDRIGQDLALAKMRLGMLTRVANGEKVSSLLNGVRESLDNALYNVRTLTRRISPPILESGSLVAALKWLCRQVESDYGLQVLFDDDGNEESVSRDIRGEIYNAVRELLINVIKHAGATSARVVVGSDKGRLLVRVEDDGIGFDPLSVDACSTGEASGFGLSNVRRRINHLGGTLRIESVPGDGCRISIGVAVAAIPPVA